MNTTNLNWQYFPTDEAGFFHNSVLVWGAQEAILIDGPFRYSEGRKIADAISRTGADLAAVYVSCNDPDYYFGLKPVLDNFPAAKLIAAPETVAAIVANIDEKLAVWAEKIGDDGPIARAGVRIPSPFDGDHLTIDGEQIEIITHPGLFDRRTLHVPALRAVFGGTMIASGGHVWMAETPRHETIAAWATALEELLRLNPRIVVPGHSSALGVLTADAIRFTHGYLLAFEDERARATDSSALIAAMNSRYPDFPGAMWLDLGAKVALGEVAWGRGH